MPDVKRCPNCGAAALRDAGMCPVCEHKFPIPRAAAPTSVPGRKCPNCRALVTEGSMSCSLCGHLFQDKLKPTAQIPSAEPASPTTQTRQIPGSTPPTALTRPGPLRDVPEPTRQPRSAELTTPHAADLAYPPPSPASEPRMRTRPWAAIWAITSIVLIFIIIAIVMGLMSITTATPQNAYLMAKSFVAENLYAPKTARFPVYEVGDVRELPNKVYDVAGYVDSANEFGVPRRQTWDVHTQYHGNGEWRLVHLEIDNQVLADSPELAQ